MRLLLAVLLAGCADTTSVVATKYIATLELAAGSAGAMVITNEESGSLAGLKLEVPAGALSTATRITLELGLDPLATSPDVAATAVALFEPREAPLLKGFTLSFPITTSSTSQPVGLLEAADGRHELNVTLTDPTQPRARVVLEKLGAVQIVQRACSATNTPCTSQGVVCGLGRCQAGQACCCGGCVSSNDAGVCPQVCQTCASGSCGVQPGVACNCNDGTPGCFTGRCLLTPAGSCAWEFRTCP